MCPQGLPLCVPTVGAGMNPGLVCVGGRGEEVLLAALRSAERISTLQQLLLLSSVVIATSELILLTFNLERLQ